MKLIIRLHDTQIIHEKSMYSVFDLLADVGGLLDIFIVVFSIIIQRYNSSLFLFNVIKKLYLLKEPITDSFAEFFYIHNFGCCSKSESKDIIDLCEETLEKELDSNNLLVKLRQFEVLIHVKSLLKLVKSSKLKHLRQRPIEIYFENGTTK